MMEYLVEIFILAMLAIVLLQSGLDKVFDWTGNLKWLTGHFAKTPFKNSVKLLLATTTLMEIGAGVLSVLGIIMLVFFGKPCMAIAAAVLSIVNFLSLLLGQRITKDYVGAQTIIIYLIPTFFLLYLLLGH